MKIEKFQLRKEWKYGDYRNGVLCVYRNDIIISETPYESGKKQGKVKTYYEDGSLESEQEYSNGICNGKCINYDKRGNIIQVCTFKDGILVNEGNECYDFHEYEDEKYY